MNEIIRKRKSIRKYDPTPLDDSSLKRVHEKIEKIIPLYPEIKYSVKIIEKTKGLFNIKAPHYLVLNSEDKEGSYENIGFIGQQMDLFFSEAGLGSCWLGASKPDDKETSDFPCIICISFGRPAEPLYRTHSEFKRKSLSKMSEGADERLEAARLAPSGMNMQNWFFTSKDDKIHCYKKKSLLGFMDKLSSIDIGIAIFHIASESENFSFSKETNVSEKKGYLYIGTVSSNRNDQ